MSGQDGRMTNNKGLSSRIDAALSAYTEALALNSPVDVQGMAAVLRDAKAAVDDQEDARAAIEAALNADDYVGDVRIWDSAEAHDILEEAQRRFSPAQGGKP